MKGRVVLITGAGNGIGRAHALACAREGAKVVVNDLGGARDGSGADGGAAAKVVAEIEAMGGEALASTVSVTDAEGCRKMVEETLKRFGRLDAVVNNAGILRDRTFARLTDEEWDLVVSVHLKGSYNVIKAALSALTAAAKETGHAAIINTTSYSGMIGNFGQSNYAAAKAGIYGMTRVLSMELQKAQITVNAVAPIAKTRMTEELSMVAEEWTPEQISPIVVFLASSLGKGVTGRVFGVQGQRIHLYEVKVNDGVEKAGHELWTPAEIAERFEQITAWEQPKATESAGNSPVHEAFALLPLAFEPERAGTDYKTRLHFQIKDGASHTLIVENGAARIEVGLKGAADATLKTDTETILGLMNQTLDPQKAFMSGKITADNLGPVMKFAMYFDFSKKRPGAEEKAAPVVEPSTEKKWPIGKIYDGGFAFAEPGLALAYAAATSDTSPAYQGSEAICPPMFHVRLFQELLFRIATDPELELDMLRLVHGQHEATFHQPIRPWDLVALRARLESVEEKSSGLLVTSKLFGFVDGVLAVEATTAYFIRGKKKGEGGNTRTEAAPPAPSFTTTIQIAPDQSLRYADASLDRNPIHTDPATAAAAGLPGVILQGLCTMAMTGAAIVREAANNDARRLKKLGVRFAKPVLNDSQLTVVAWKQGDGKYAVETRDSSGSAVISNAVVELA